MTTGPTTVDSSAALSGPDAPPRRSVRIGGVLVEYDERVLRPRPWTAMQGEWAAELLAAAPDGPVLELCCGAGHIGLVAVVAATDRRMVAVDADEVACAFARLNAEGAGVAHRVEVRHGRLDAAVGDGERFALVIADPPWVPSEQTGRFPEDPLLAIDGGSDGLGVAHECVAVAGRSLAPGGSLLLQVGDDEQADAVVQRAAGAWTETARRAGAGGVVLRLVRTDL